MVLEFQYSSISPGPPLPPQPHVDVMSTTELKVSWEEPFTFEPFPILDYTVTVYTSSEPDDIHTYNVTDQSTLLRLDTETATCSLLTFEVTARNAIERSKRGKTSGGFPVGEFMHYYMQEHTHNYLEYFSSGK